MNVASVLCNYTFNECGMSDILSFQTMNSDFLIKEPKYVRVPVAAQKIGGLQIIRQY
jgi:hypothetical protein